MLKLLIILACLLLPINSFSQDREQIITFLHDIETTLTRDRGEIIFIEEFNFGIPGGSNWLAIWSYLGFRVPIIYAIDYANREIMFRHQIGLMTRNDPPHVASWYQSLPGITIDTGRGMLQVGDFSGTGYTQIITFVSAVVESHYSIGGYDPVINRIRRSRFYHVNSTESNEPPVVFIRYRGLDGFKLHYYQPLGVAGGATWVSPPPSPNNNRWFFYTWDEKERVFAKVEEVNPAYVEEIDHSRFIPRLSPRAE